MSNTIVYLTDNTLDEQVAAFCQRILVREARDIPIISVSQKPVALGHNICVGEIGRNWISLYTQLLAGVEAADSDWIVVAEHDCLYTYEHLSYRPNDPAVFHYNFNNWLVQWGGNHPELNGMYSFWPRRLALSQMIAHKTLARQCLVERLDVLEHGGRMDKQFLGCGEFGLVSERALEKAAKWAASGQAVQLQQYLHDYLQNYNHKSFGTVNPNLDIRHSSNFTGPKRGKKRTYELPYWGRFADIMAAS